MSLIHPSRLRLATVLSVKAPVGPIVVDHVGLVSAKLDQHGLPYVYNASKRSRFVKLERWDVFTLGKGSATILEHIRGDLPDDEVIERAHSKLDDPWDLWSANCEHYVRWCHGLEVTSPQLRAGVGVVVGVAAVGTLLVMAALAEE
ncbi:MAG: lecithin retinol acyltransferase family protein [Myxococcota bacterium]